MAISVAGTSNNSRYSPSGPSPLFSVYLSFRGTDTWKTFTGHLSAALDRAGIRSCKDDRQLKGEECLVELIDPIRESMISIVIFSKNYASSRLCLEELVEIMECKRKGELEVFPVYYDVKPTVVKGSFAEALAIGGDFSTDQIDQVQRWAAALEEASCLSGYQLSDYANGDEAVLIKSIVEDVRFKALNKKFSYVAQYPVGIESRVRDIYQILSIGSNDVRFIGIYGMGGIGKTSTVKAMYNRTSHHFERSCFLTNRGASYESHSLVSSFEQFIFKFLKRNFTVDNVDEGLFIIKYRLYSIRALIVLDDLDLIAQLKPLTGNRHRFGSGSRVIITTRDVGLLRRIQVDAMYEVKELDHYESLELFSRHAFRNTIPLKDFMELSEGIVSFSGGLPLALEVIGSYLFGRTMEEWKSAFEKMQLLPSKIQNSEIQKKLKMSYDVLDDMTKEIFLDIACFFLGMDRDDAISIMNGCGFHSEIGIDILRERCLLRIDGVNQLRMHDLIRDMGREIVREESPKIPEKRSRLWCHKDAYYVLRELKGTETIEGIKLEMTENEHLTTRTFEKLHNLRLLQISNIHLTGSFENLFTELRWLCWHYCPLECLPSSFHPPNLVLLDMQYSNVHRLWHVTKHLKYLRILNVSHSQFLITTPDFGGLEKLEKLLLRNCSSLEHIHPSIGILSKLGHLDLSGCLNLNKLPEQLGYLEGLKKLDASSTTIKELPDSFGHLSKLVELNLEECRNLGILPSTICHLTSLEVLSLDSCSKLEKLPEKLGDIQCLRQLDASRTAIEQLPDSIGHLSRLVKLKLEGCENLRELPSSIFHLTSLEVLNLESCSNLHLINCTSLRSLLEFPPTLKELDLTNCSSLQSLPELPPNLENIYARGCTSLEKLPILSRLNHLKSLNLENCSSLQLLMDLPPNLCKLDLTNCSNLRSLPILHPNLHHLSLTGCNGLESLPEIPSDLEFFTF